MSIFKNIFRSQVEVEEGEPTEANKILQRKIETHDDIKEAIADLKEVGSAEAAMAAVIMIGSDRYYDADSPIFDQEIVQEHLIPSLKEMDMGAWALSAFAAEQARVYDHVDGDELGLRTDEHEVLDVILGVGGDEALTALHANIKSYYPDETGTAIEQVLSQMAAETEAKRTLG